MLVAVPTSINRSNRLVVLRHPNAFEVVVSRKQVQRAEADPATGNPNEMGGAPTMGGMGVLRSEDEAEFEYVELGEGRCLFTGGSMPIAMNEADSAPIAENLRECMIESKFEPGTPGHWIVERGDLVALNLGLGVIMAYEVAEITGTVAIPPHTRKVLLNPRDDLAYVEPFTD